jgi:hypothetical protein
LKSLLLSPYVKEKSASGLTAAETVQGAGRKKMEMSGKSLFFFFKYGL